VKCGSTKLKFFKTKMYDIIIPIYISHKMINHLSACKNNLTFKIISIQNMKKKKLNTLNWSFKQNQ